MKVYLDHGATTPLDKRVLSAMLPYLTRLYGNPSSSHYAGRESLAALDRARDGVASLAGVKPLETYFTASGSEADNWAFKGIARAVRRQSGKNKIVLSAIEHHALLNSAKALQAEGFTVVFLPVDEQGFVRMDAVDSAVEGAGLVSVMAANNEVGTVQPIGEIAERTHRAGGYFMTDAVQAAGSLDLKKITAVADAVVLSAHKFYGPKGAGALLCKRGVPLSALIDGGEQERGLRGGTSDTASAVGLYTALSLAAENRAADGERIGALRDYFIEGVLSEIAGVSVNGGRQNRLCGNANLRFDGVDGTALLHLLDAKGICASAGSACASGSIAPSHVLTAMGLSEREANSSLRFTFGRENTVRQAEYAVQTLKTLVRKLRRG